MKVITIRRTLQQLRHCIVEADGVWARKEDPKLALEDLEQAELLLKHALKLHRMDPPAPGSISGTYK